MKLALGFIIFCSILIILNSPKSHGLQTDINFGPSTFDRNASNVLRVATRRSLSFFYHDKLQNIPKGIDYELLKVIGAKLDLKIHFQETNNFSSVDVVAGGISILSDELRNSSDWILTTPYFEDKFIWCVRRADYYPYSLNVFFLASPACWILVVFGFGYGTGFILFIFIQFDEKYKQRNQRGIIQHG